MAGGCACPVLMRPVQWPRMSRFGSASAVTMRTVIGPSPSRSAEWTLPTTTSSRGQHVRLLVERSVLVDVDLDPGQQPKRRQLRVERRDLVELRLSRSVVSPLATVRRGEWSVMHEVLVAELDRRLGHLADARAAVGGHGVGVAVAAQRRAQLGRRPRPAAALGRLQPSQVDRLLAAQALEDRPLGDLADARQLPQRPAAARSRELIGPASREGGRGVRGRRATR